MSRAQKVRRRAHADDRDRARELVELYRRAQRAPDGRLCLNPDDDSNDQHWIDGTDPTILLQALERFATSGTFALEMDFTPLVVRAQYRELLSTGLTSTQAQERLAEQQHVDPRTVQRWLRSHHDKA